ncbi:MAG: hypothetical protein PHI97_04660 [Desulfobulbus sp.]|nr:hypothetical protein [Desulfobulbus sp.]
MSTAGLRWAAVLCCLLLAGCAGKLPKTTPLAAGESQQALDTWSRFLHFPHPSAVDADYRLRWNVLGSKGGIDAVVQMKQPAMLRFSANDPLGRALILVVSDGNRFTFVDNRAAEVYQGKTDSKFWHSYMADSIQTTDLFAYLGGYVDPNQVTTVEPLLDEAGQGYWYIWQDRRKLTHYVLLAGKQGQIQRHLLVDQSGNQVLDLRYSGTVRSAKGAEKDLLWPEKVDVSGEAVTGDVQLQVEKIYAFSLRGTNVFRLTLPPHFSIEQVK